MGGERGSGSGSRSSAAGASAAATCSFAAAAAAAAVASAAAARSSAALAAASAASTLASAAAMRDSGRDVRARARARAREAGEPRRSATIQRHQRRDGPGLVMPGVSVTPGTPPASDPRGGNDPPPCPGHGRLHKRFKRFKRPAWLRIPNIGVQRSEQNVISDLLVYTHKPSD